MNRKLAMAWLRRGCLGPAVMLRILMEPLRQYLAAQFTRASAEWELEQQGRVAAAKAKGEQHTRKLRLVDVAKGEQTRSLQLR